MIIINTGSVIVNGILNGEDIVIKTAPIDKFANQKVLLLDLFVITKRQYLEFNNLPDNQKLVFPIMPLQITGFSLIETEYTQDLATSWQAQNELVKQKLIELGVPETAIQIVEDITE